jgi:hypothetical protein
MPALRSSSGTKNAGPFTANQSFAPPTTPVPRRVLDDPALQDQILHDYFDGANAVFTIAQKHGLTIDELVAFVRSDRVYARRKDLEALAAERARTIAILNLPAAIQRLADTIADPSAHPSEARRAANSLIRAATARPAAAEPPPTPTSEGAGPVCGQRPTADNQEPPPPLRLANGATSSGQEPKAKSHHPLSLNSTEPPAAHQVRTSRPPKSTPRIPARVQRNTPLT